MFHQRGFSLVELSIVLVILGLLTGGILGGQSLIQAAKLRSVGQEAKQYVDAVMIFKDRYDSIPGDMPDAEAHWGTAAAGDAACKAFPSVGTETCNGDGDGRLIHTIARSNESFRFWQHLANAGMIEGKYTGINGDVSGTPLDHIPGTNCPTSKFGGRTGWSAVYIQPDASGNTWLFDNAEIGNALLFGQCSGWDCVDTALTPSEMWSIDSKMDDGRPGTGRVITRPDGVSGHPDCVEGDNTEALTATYQLENDFPACAFYYRQAY